MAAYNTWKASNPKGKGKAVQAQELPIVTSNTDKSSVSAKPMSAIEQSIASNTVLSTTAGGDDSDPRLSYQEIVAMIKDGKENDLPGIKDIPDTVLEGQGTTSTQAQRRKPWEKDQSSSIAHGSTLPTEVSISQ